MIAIELGEGHTRYVRGEIPMISDIQAETLGALDSLGEATTGMLAKALHIRASTVTDRMNRLVRAGKVSKSMSGKKILYRKIS